MIGDRVSRIFSRMFDIQKTLVSIHRQSHTRTLPTGEIVPVRDAHYVMETLATGRSAFQRGEQVTIVASTEYMRPGEIIDNTVAHLFLQQKPAIKKKLEAEAEASGMSGAKKRDYVKTMLDAWFSDYKRGIYEQIEGKLHEKRTAIEETVKARLKTEGHTGRDYESELKCRVERLILGDRAAEYSKIFDERIQGTNIPGRVTQCYPEIDRVQVSTAHGDFMVPAQYVAKKRTPGMSGDQHLSETGMNVYEMIDRDSEPYRKKHALQRQHDADEEVRIVLVDKLRHVNASEAQKLVYEHMDYADNMARHYYRKYAARMQGLLEYDDLRQQATLGLVRAANAYTVPGKVLGSEFAVYAHGYITTEIRENIMRGLQICQMPIHQFRRWIRYQKHLEMESFLPEDAIVKINTLSRSYADRKEPDRQAAAWKRNYGEARNALIDVAFREQVVKYPLISPNNYLSLTTTDKHEQQAADIEMSTKMQHRQINQYMAAAINQSNDRVTNELGRLLTPHEHTAFKLFSYGWDEHEIGRLLIHVDRNRGTISDAIDYTGSAHQPLKKLVENPANYYFQDEFKRLLGVYGKDSNPDSIRRLMTDDQRLVYDHLHDPVSGGRRSVRQVVEALPENQKRSIGKVHKDLSVIDNLSSIAGGSGEKIFAAKQTEDAVGRHFLDRARVKILEAMPLLERVSGYRFVRVANWKPKKLMDV